MGNFTLTRDEIDLLLRGAGKGEPGAFEQLVESTYQEAFQRCGGDEETLTSVYRTMKAHLFEVHRRAEFWVWFEQIAPPCPRTDAEAPPDLRQRLLDNLAGPAKVAQRSSLKERVGRLYLNGWLAWFGLFLGLGAVWILASGESFALALALGVVFGALGASVASWFFGPWLGLWHRRRGARRTLLLSPIMLCLALYYKGMARSHEMEDAGYAYAGVAPEEQWWAWLCLGLFVALLLSSAFDHWGRRTFAQSRWLLYRGNATWRSVPGVLLVVSPLIYGLCFVLPLLWGGYFLEAQLMDLQAGRIAHPADSQLPPAEAPLPNTLAFDPAIVALSESYDRDPERADIDSQIGAAARAWTREASKVWPRPGAEQSPTMRALVRYAEDLALTSQGETLNADQEELGVSLQLLGESDQEDRLSRLQTVGLSGSAWQRLAEKAQSQTDIFDPVTFGEKEVLESYSDAVERVEPLLRTSDSWRDFLYALEERQMLNEAWRSYVKEKRGIDSPMPWDPDTARRVEGWMSDDKVDLGTREVSYGASEFSESYREMAFLVLYLELRRLAASGEPVPTDAGKLRPYFARVGKAYQGWFKLHRRGGKVEFQTLDAGGKVKESFLIPPDKAAAAAPVEQR